MQRFRFILAVSATSLCAVFFVGIVYAGSLSPTAPPTTPAATSYTLTNIYNRLTTNATATAGDHAFAPSGAPAASFKTLTQIYEAIPTITPNLVKLGTPYLGVTGTLTPDGGTAAVGDLFSGKTANITNDWNLDTGILNLACNTATFDGTANKVADAYDGGGDGTNRWCITDSGDAAAGDILATKKAWVDGLEVTGSVTAGANVTGGNGLLTFTIPNGLYSASKTCTAADSNLVTGNIKKDSTIFGVAGSSTVVDTTTGTAGVGDILATKKAWVSGSELTGTMTDRDGDSVSTAQAAALGVNYLTAPVGYYDGDDRVSATDAQIAALDSDIAIGNIRNGISIFGVAGSTNVVDTTTGDAAATDILASKKAWVDGAEVTGNIATQTLSAANQTVTAGYYAATTLSAVDSDLVAAKIMTGATIFGVVGSYRGYPGTGWVANGSGDGSTPLNQANCAAASGWYWFADGNGDGDTTDPEDGICVQGTEQTAAGSWNGNTNESTIDNSYIAAYTCSGNFPNGTVATYSGFDISGNVDTTWNAGDCALCQADCYDGKKDLPGQGAYTSPNTNQVGGVQGPVTHEVLKNWKGTRLPT